MGLKFTTACRNAMLDGITATVGNAGKLRILTGASPASAGDAETGVLLAELTLGSPFDAAASGGTLTPTLPSNVIASASGTASYWRLTTSAGSGAPVAQGSCGANMGDLSLTTTALVSGVPVQINSWNWTATGA